MTKTDRFHKQVFERISDAKRESIFDAAISEFATEGYGAANINTIAAKAGVSVGAMYTYFYSKEDLYLAMAERGLAIFREILGDIKPGALDFFETVERLFYLTIRYAKEHKNLCRLYLELMTEQMVNMAKRLSHKMEADFCAFYTDLIEHAKANGEIDPDQDSGLLGLYLDNLVISLQLAFSTTYYSLRLNQYMGEAAAANEKLIVDGLVNLVRGSVGVSTSGRSDG